MKDPNRKRSPDMLPLGRNFWVGCSCPFPQIHYLKCCHIRADPEKTLLYFYKFQAFPKGFRFPCFGLDPSLGTAPSFPFLGVFCHEIFEWMNVFVSEHAELKHNHVLYPDGTSEVCHHGFPYLWGEDCVLTYLFNYKQVSAYLLYRSQRWVALRVFLKSSARGYSIIREVTVHVCPGVQCQRKTFSYMTFMRHNDHPLVKDVDAGTREPGFKSQLSL